jgi:hypothetical protein
MDQVLAQVEGWAAEFYRLCERIGLRFVRLAVRRRVVGFLRGLGDAGAGRAGTAEFIDRVEVGRRVAGAHPGRFRGRRCPGNHVRAGCRRRGGHRRARPTLFQSTNARLSAPAGLQLTLFQVV